MSLALLILLWLLPWTLWAQLHPFPGPGRKSSAGGGPVVLATDTFNRANSTDLGATWTPLTGHGSFSIVLTTIAQATDTGSDSAELYTGITWPLNQYAQAVLATGQTGAGLGTGYGVILRGQSGTDNAYRFVANTADGTYWLDVCCAAGALIASGTGGFVAGDTLRLEATGASPTTLKMFRNGVQVGANQTNSLAATQVAGSAGIGYSSTVTAGGLDSWEGGSLP